MVNTVRDCYFILFDTKYFILIGTSERQECKGRGGGGGGGGGGRDFRRTAAAPI